MTESEEKCLIGEALQPIYDESSRPADLDKNFKDWPLGKQLVIDWRIPEDN